MGLQKNFADLKSTFRRSSATNQHVSRLSVVELERLRNDLEDLLALYEPSQIGTAADLLKHYEGLEYELVDCYRQYYNKDDNMHPNQAPQRIDAISMNNNEHTKKTNIQRKRLSTPASFFKSKLRPKRTNSTSKMDSIAGPSVVVSPQKSDSWPAHGFRLPKRYSFSDILQRLKLSADHADEKSDQEPLQTSSKMSFPVRCLDTGEEWFMDDVNFHVLEKQKDLVCTKRKSFREKIVIFLQKYDMAAIDSVDELLAFGGKTNDEIWDDLQAKYKVNQRSRLLKLFEKYDPSNVSNVDALLIEYASSVEEMIAFYKAKFNQRQIKEVKRQDPCTWSPGQPNSYQLLPGGNNT